MSDSPSMDLRRWFGISAASALMVLLALATPALGQQLLPQPDEDPPAGSDSPSDPDNPDNPDDPDDDDDDDDPDSGPGCSVSYGIVRTVTPDLTGRRPMWPCSMSCGESSDENARQTVLDEIGGRDGLWDACNFQGPNTWENFDYSPLWPPGERVTPRGRGAASATRCTVHTGEQYGFLPVYTRHYPQGHPKCGGVIGDPHLNTFDSVGYKLQAAGEFIVAGSLDDDFEVQMRLKPLFGLDYVSYPTAVAAKVGAQVVIVESDSETPLRIDGAPARLDHNRYLRFEGGGGVVRTRNRWGGVRYSIVWPDGTNVHAEIFSPVLNFFVLPAEARDGRLQGLLGDADGDRSRELKTRQGRVVEFPLDFESLYGVLAESWRVSDEESLFHYEEGENTHTFTNRDHPSRIVTIDDLEPEVRERAEQRCRAGGVVEPEALETCIYDFGFSGDEVYIQSAASLQKPPEWAPAITIEAPAEAVASHNIEIRLDGPVEAGPELRFAPAGSLPSGRAANPYTSTVLHEDGTQTIELATPSLPGDYELRYIASSPSGQVWVLQSQPFRSTAPEVTMEAPSSVEAAPEIVLPVQLSGDIGGRMVVVVVPAGSPDETPGPNLGLTQGDAVDDAVRIYNAEPGEYEIRLVSSGGVGVQVYARKALTIR